MSIIFENRKCRFCNNKISPRAIKAYKWYCSNSCKKGIPLIKKECEVCGKIFNTSIEWRKFCSQWCVYKNKNLVHQKNKKERVSDFSIFHRDNFRCIYCGKSSIEDGVKLNIEHIISIFNNGESEIENLITSCEKCNLSKNIININSDIIDRIKSIIRLRNSKLNQEELTQILDQILTLKKMDTNRKDGLIN